MFGTGILAPMYQRLFAAKLPAPVTTSPDIKTITIGPWSFEMMGDPDDPYFNNLQAFVSDHPELFDFASQRLSPDGVVLDVGANIGVTALMLSRICERGHVYAFEPSPINLRFLRRNLELNGVENCTVIASGAGAEPGELRFHPSGAGSHMMTENHEFYDTWANINVPITTIDQFIIDYGPPRIDFIKMDVEGFEPQALAGAAKTIRQFSPYIFMEFNSWSLYFAHKVDPLSFARQLFEQYTVAKVASGGELVATSDYAEFLHENMTRNGCVDDLVLRIKAPLRQIVSDVGRTIAAGHDAMAVKSIPHDQRVWQDGFEKNSIGCSTEAIGHDCKTSRHAGINRKPDSASRQANLISDNDHVAK